MEWFTEDTVKMHEPLVNSQLTLVEGGLVVGFLGLGACALPLQHLYFLVFLKLPPFCQAKSPTHGGGGGAVTK